MTPTTLEEKSAAGAAVTMTDPRTGKSASLPISGGAILRSLIPVRSVIQASVVSTIFSRSAFVRTMGGR